ncbi:MAG: prolipoprotein diacylglyceryl transferase [Chloroflexi bacterium]|nr:prolipoprotein diacylglyceryl transferase [Chloroflexota bacterium]
MNDILTTIREVFAPPRHLILIILAGWIGLAISERRMNRGGSINIEFDSLWTYSLAAFLVGGRLSFVLQNLSAFSEDLLGILSINPGIFDPLGGTMMALVTIRVLARKKKISFWVILDTATPFLALLMMGVSLSQFAAGTSFGRETDLPWGYFVWNAMRHPAQLYDFLLGLIVFIGVWRQKPFRTSGILFLCFTSMTAAAKLLVANFRAEGDYIFLRITEVQLAAWLTMATSFLLIEYRIAQAGHRDRTRKAAG